MRKMLAFLIIGIVSQNVFAGPFVAGGNGVMSMAYCNTESGDFGANVSKDFDGKVFGYSWTNDQATSKVAPVTIRQAQNPGTPDEKPMVFRSQNFQIRIFMGNLPAEFGAPIYRTGEVRIKQGKKWLTKMLSCTLFGI